MGHSMIVRRSAAVLFVALIFGATAAQATVAISTQPTVNMSCSGGVCIPTASDAVLNVNDLANMLASGDVTVQSGSLARDIEVDAPLRWTSTSRLTLDSYHTIAFNRPLIVEGTGALTITTNGGGFGGDFKFAGRGRAEFQSVNSNLMINGQAYKLAENIRQVSRALKSGARFVALSRDFDSGSQEFKRPPILSLKGTLEGLGNTIKNLKVHDSTTSENAALIGDITATGLVRDLNLTAVDILGNAEYDQLVAALAGKSDGGTALNVHVTGTIAASSSDSLAGGLMGESNGTIRRCSADVSVSTTGQSEFAGGLLGINYEQDSTALPGIVSESFSTGSVSLTTAGSSAGGLVGDAAGGSISNSYSLATVSGDGAGDTDVGGFAAYGDDGLGFTLVISSSYSTGLLSGTDNSRLGGFIVYVSGPNEISNSYWDIDTTGTSQGCDGCSGGVTGLTDAQLKSGLPNGFDKKVWKQSATINNCYPYLIDNPPPK